MSAIIKGKQGFVCGSIPTSPGDDYSVKSLDDLDNRVYACLVCILVTVFLIARYTNIIPRVLDIFEDELMPSFTLIIQTNDLLMARKWFNRGNANTELYQNGILLSPLAIAAQCGHVEIMDYLWAIGADIYYVQNQSGGTILHFACQSGQPRAIKWCLGKGILANKVTLGN